MESLLSYSQYDYLIIFVVDDSEGFEVWGSLNRAVSLSLLKRMKTSVMIDKDLGLLVRRIFLQYFRLHSRDRNQLLATEMSTVISILDCFKDIKEDLTTNSSVSLKTSQIIVVPPSLAEWDIHMLRSLFLEAEWITAEDDDTKLILVPYIEACVNDLQMSGALNLERERKYMMLYMQPSEERGKIKYTTLCFQMQCAKELIAVSKRLASSGFLLIPSILSSRTVSLPSVDNALLIAALEAITRFRNNRKAQHGASFPKIGETLLTATTNETTAKVKGQFKIWFEVESKDSKTATELTRRLLNISYHDYKNSMVADLLNGMHDKSDLQELGKQPIDQFCMELFQDTNVKQHTEAVCDFLQEILDEYSLHKDAPDGIRNIILVHNESSSYLYCFCLQAAMSQAEAIIYHDVSFLWEPEEVARRAIQRSLKITQITNGLLPPLICTDSNENAEATSNVYRCDKNSDLLPLNSFYLQANIGERHIEFILNKVVKAPSSTAPVGLFTAQERKIEIEDIQTATSGNTWSHYQLLESEGRLDALISCCPQHENISLSLSHYQCFIASMKDLLNIWLISESILSNDELDVYHLIPISRNCSCALKISHRMLLETGLKPAIASIAEIIVGTTLSVDHFGLYQLSALFVKGGMDAIGNECYSHFLKHHLQESLSKHLESHRRKITIFLVNKQTENTIIQYLVQGNYTQIASSFYSIALRIDSKEHDFPCGILDDPLNATREFPGSQTFSSDSMRIFQSDYTILNKGEDIPVAGIERTILMTRSDNVRIGCNVLSSSRAKTDCIQLGALIGYAFTYFTISVLPVHHSSALRVSVSTIGKYFDNATLHSIALVDIQERLCLKRIIRSA